MFSEKGFDYGSFTRLMATPKEHKLLKNMNDIQIKRFILFQLEKNQNKNKQLNEI